MRVRVDKLIQKIKVNDTDEDEEFITFIKKLSIEDRINLEDAKLIIKNIKMKEGIINVSSIWICNCDFINWTSIFLSRRENVYWGICLPIVYVITLLYLWITEALTVKGNTLIFIIIILGGLAILLGIWIKGREELKINRKKNWTK